MRPELRAASAETVRIQAWLMCLFTEGSGSNEQSVAFELITAGRTHRLEELEPRRAADYFARVFYEASVVFREI